MDRQFFATLTVDRNERHLIIICLVILRIGYRITAGCFLQTAFYQYRVLEFGIITVYVPCTACIPALCSPGKIYLLVPDICRDSLKFFGTHVTGHGHRIPHIVVHTLFLVIRQRIQFGRSIA